VAYDGLEGEKKSLENTYDLIILDIMLPHKDGNVIAQKLRAFENYTPILMLTAKTEEIGKVLGPEPGDFRIMIGASSNDIRLRGI